MIFPRRIVLSLLLFAMAGAGFAAPVPTRGMERRFIGGKEYVRVRDWCKAAQMTTTWIKPDRVLQLSGRAGTVVLIADSREARSNGVDVWLSHPPVMGGGKAWLSAVDFKTTLGPLLFPVKESKRVRVIALDAGHGGKDKGFVDGAKYEKDYTLLLAREVEAQLVLAGFRVVQTRTSDTFLELSSRPELARQRRADLFLSLHFNSGGPGNVTARGVETYCVTPVGAASTNARGEGADHPPVVGNLQNDKNVLLAFHVQRALVTSLGLADRGLRRARFEVLREATMPAALVEGGFLSHPVEKERIYSPLFRRQMAKAIVAGVQNYRRAVEGK